MIEVTADYETIKKEYKENERFKDFVNAYATGRRITVDEALRHEITRNVFRDYKEKNLK